MHTVMRRNAHLLLTTWLLLLGACTSSRPAAPQSVIDRTADDTAVIFRDVAQPLEARIADLVARLTLDEKASLLMHASPAIERLGIPAYNWWNECLHGVGRAGQATVFPQAIGLAATFDENLIRQVAEAISDEARAKHNMALAQGRHEQYWGLTFWSPNINIYRDPRWGRGQETYGEDPYLTGLLGSAFVRGLQGDDPQYLKVAACAKHFAVHSGPEESRHHFNAVVTKKDLYETYLPAFKKLVDANVEAIMCAYNRLDGQACCGSSHLLTEILRQELGFQGHVVSDCGALNDMHEGHAVTNDATESAAIAVEAGVNLECGNVYLHVIEAVERGLITEDDVDVALVPVLRTRFRLGMFDPPDAVPYADIPPDVINCPKHRALACETAEKSIVLLKNKNGILPFPRDIESLYVVGPNAATIEPLLGNYHGLSRNMVTILEGIVDKMGPGQSVGYAQTCFVDHPSPASNAGPISVAKGASAIVAVVGLTSLYAGERGDAIGSADGGDCLQLTLPGSQLEMLRRLREDNDKPLIVVVTGGGPLAMPEVHELADAILFAWYPGEQGGAAVANVLFGDSSPSGRLPVTFPASVEQLPAYDDYSMSGRTYRFMQEAPLYPFGFGLSYTEFRYADMQPSKRTLKRGEGLTVHVTLENTGPRAGEEVAQLYVSAEERKPGSPLTTLASIKRVKLAPGQSTRVRFEITPDMLSQINEHGERVQLPGKYRITVGSASPSARSTTLGAPRPITQVILVQ